MQNCRMTKREQNTVKSRKEKTDSSSKTETKQKIKTYSQEPFFFLNTMQQLN